MCILIYSNYYFASNVSSMFRLKQKQTNYRHYACSRFKNASWVAGIKRFNCFEYKWKRCPACVTISILLCNLCNVNYCRTLCRHSWYTIRDATWPQWRMARRSRSCAWTATTTRCSTARHLATTPTRQTALACRRAPAVVSRLAAASRRACRACRSPMTCTMTCRTSCSWRVGWTWPPWRPCSRGTPPRRRAPLHALRHATSERPRILCSWRTRRWAASTSSKRGQSSSPWSNCSPTPDSTSTTPTERDRRRCISPPRCLNRVTSSERSWRTARASTMRTVANRRRCCERPPSAI